MAVLSLPPPCPSSSNFRNSVFLAAASCWAWAADTNASARNATDNGRTGRKRMTGTPFGGQRERAHCPLCRDWASSDGTEKCGERRRQVGWRRHVRRLILAGFGDNRRGGFDASSRRRGGGIGRPQVRGQRGGRRGGGHDHAVRRRALPGRAGWVRRIVDRASGEGG